LPIKLTSILVRGCCKNAAASLADCRVQFETARVVFDSDIGFSETHRANNSSTV